MFIVLIGDGAYRVGKHALNALRGYISHKNQGHGIRVDVICPGMVTPEMGEDQSDLDRHKSPLARISNPCADLLKKTLDFA